MERSARRFCGSWCPEVGELISVRMRALRDLDGRWVDIGQGGDDRSSLAVVIGRYDGSKDWTILTVLAEDIIGTVHCTSMYPVANVKRTRD